MLENYLLALMILVKYFKSEVVNDPLIKEKVLLLVLSRLYIQQTRLQSKQCSHNH